MGERNGRKNYIKQSGIKGITTWLVFALFLVKMIYMSYKNGMQGMSYYALADLIFIVGYLMMGLAVVPVMKKMICFQINKGSYKNGIKVYKTISRIMLATSLFVSVVIFVCSEAVSVVLFGTVLCSMMLKFVAAALFVAVIGFCLKGYMEGIGNPVPGMYADVLSHLIGLIVTILFQPMFADYGRKVAALMRQDAYAYAYSACSGSLGLLLGCLSGFLFLLLVKGVFGKEIKKRAKMEETRKTDSARDIMFNYVLGYCKTAFVDYIGVILAAVLLILYCHVTGHAQTGAGMLFSVIVVSVLPVGILASQITAPFARQLGSIMRQSDFHHAKERMAFYLKLLSYSVSLFVALGFALAFLYGNIFFDVEVQEFAVYMRIGAVTSMLLALGIFFRQTFSVLAKPYVRNVYAAILGITGILFFVLLSKNKVSAEESVSYAYMMACLVYLLIVGAAVLKKIRVFNRLGRSVVMPLVSASLAALVSFGICLLLDSKMPDILLYIVCVLCGYLLYNMLIAVVKIFDAHEWNEVPFSNVAVKFAKLTGRY